MLPATTKPSRGRNLRARNPPAGLSFFKIQCGIRPAAVRRKIEPKKNVKAVDDKAMTLKGMLKSGIGRSTIKPWVNCSCHVPAAPGTFLGDSNCAKHSELHGIVKLGISPVSGSSSSIQAALLTSKPFSQAYENSCDRMNSLRTSKNTLTIPPCGTVTVMNISVGMCRPSDRTICRSNRRIAVKPESSSLDFSGNSSMAWNVCQRGLRKKGSCSIYLTCRVGPALVKRSRYLPCVRSLRPSWLSTSRMTDIRRVPGWASGIVALDSLPCIQSAAVTHS
mmetsp:Transcript_14621/g.28786  ORF Transcript_14621/g.28786 Transcript_14621/m.28786 type:complete len:278 (-) Transcript_14621:1045-1878(-)